MNRLLLDTHIWLWSIVAPDKLGSKGLSLLEDMGSELYFSAASSWEIAIKYRLGRLPLPEPPNAFIPPRLVRDGIRPLSVAHDHACRVADLPDIHRDPFDRLIIAQAQTEHLVLMTADRILSTYDVEMILVGS